MAVPIPKPRFRSIVIDHTKVAADLTNFPVLIAGTFTDLICGTFGGHVTNPDGSDIAVYADSARTTLLDFELETYVPSTGQIAIWARVPSLSSTVDTTIYLAYGGPSTELANPAGVWSNSYAAVWHLDGPFTGGAGSITDSTGHGNGGTNDGGTVTAGPGQISSGAVLNGTNASLSFPDSSSLRPAAISVSTWVKLNADQFQPIFNKGNSYALSYQGSGEASVSIGDFFFDFASLPLPIGSWANVAMTYDGTFVKLYLNGSLVYNSSASGVIPYDSSSLKLGVTS